MIETFQNAHAVYKMKLEEGRKNAVLSKHKKQAANIVFLLLQFPFEY